MTVVEWFAILGWVSIGVMAAAYLVGCTGRLRLGTEVGFVVCGLVAFGMVILRFAEAF